jgi:hypothetical protein
MLEGRSGAGGDAADLGWGRRLRDRVLQAALLVTAVCTLVPFPPVMPGQGLDESWIYGINQAVAQGLSIGRDVVFTAGPYSPIYTGGYHPRTDHLMLFGGLYLGLSLGLALILATQGRHWALQTGLWVVLAGLMHSRDALFLAYPLLVAVFCVRSTEGSDDLGLGPRRALWLTVVLFLPFGVLVAIKGSFLMMAVATAALAAMLFVTGGRSSRAVAVVASLGASTAIFWWLAGQPLKDLPRYFLAMAEVSSGYGEAMAIPGDAREVVYYLIAAAGLLAAGIGERLIPGRQRAFLFLVLQAFLFLAFKGSFVRHDGHAALAGVSILIAGLVSALAVRQSRWAPAPIILAVVTWAYLDSHWMNTSTRSLNARIVGTYTKAWRGIKNRITTPDGLRQEYQVAVDGIRSRAKIRLLQGTTDIYAHGQSQLIASGNTWNPRPAFQSYSAYTAALAKSNNEHLLGANAPDNIVFRLETIDGRLPSLDDGASWASLLALYRLEAAENDWLYLRKRDGARPAAAGPIVKEGRFSMRETVPVPDSPVAVFASISIRPSLRGRVMGILYKPGPLQITLNLSDGTSRTRRLISGMASAGFLMSPWIESTEDFGTLYGGIEHLAGREVVSFAIMPVTDGGDWAESFEVVLRQAPAVAPIDISSLLLGRPGPSRPEIVAGQQLAAAPRCDGGFDIVNGASPAPARFTAFGQVAVHGWMAQSTKPALVPATVFVALSDKQGRNLLFRARRTPRPDVGRYYKEPALDASGFAATMDVATVRGEFFLRMAYLENGRIMLCPRSASSGSFQGNTSPARR